MLKKGKGIRASLVPLAVIAGLVIGAAVVSGTGTTDFEVADAGGQREALLTASAAVKGWPKAFADEQENGANHRDGAFEAATEFNGWSGSIFESTGPSRAMRAESQRLKAQAEYYLFGGMYVGTMSDGTVILAD